MSFDKVFEDILELLSEDSDQQFIFLTGAAGTGKTTLLERVKNNSQDLDLNLIDEYKLDGDFIESQAFAFLSIRSLKKLPISFPNTTRCKKSSIGGVLVENF